MATNVSFGRWTPYFCFWDHSGNALFVTLSLMDLTEE